MKSKKITEKIKGRFLSTGIKSKFLIATSLIIILMGFLTVLFMHKSQSDSMYHQLEHHNSIITKNLSATAADLILTQNILKLQNFIDDMKKNEEDIAYIYLISSKGKVLAHTFEDGFPAGLRGINTPAPGQAYSSKLLDTEEGYIRDFAVPVFNKLGTAHVGISESHIRKHITRAMWTIIFITSLLLGAGIFLINIITANVLNPIKMLSIGAKAIGSGNYGHRVEVQTNDETGSLAVSFNNMASKLQATIENLEQEMTERKWAEEQIIILNEELRHNVLQLEAANKELEAFSYSVSHDLRSPLRIVAGFSQLLFEDYADKLNPEGRDFLKRILTATHRMDRLIDDLLNLSRVSRSEMRRDEVRLSDLAGKIAEMLRKTQPERQAEFNIAEGLVAQGDEHLLTIVLENLLGNAWKFTGKNPRAVIEVGIYHPFNSPPNLGGEQGVVGKDVFFIKDNGAGFDMSNAGKMFSPFQRLHSVNEFPGTGIGLATVKRIINRHGGAVWIEGEVDKGTTVYFTLE